jgi:hypothetical protein
VNRHCTGFLGTGTLPEDAAKITMSSEAPGLSTASMAMLESPTSSFDTGNLAANWKQAHICLSRKTVSGGLCIFNAKDTSSTKSLFLKVRPSG